MIVFWRWTVKKKLQPIPGKLGTFLKYDDVDFIIKELKHNFLLPRMQKKQTNKQNHGKYSLKSPIWI